MHSQATGRTRAGMASRWRQEGMGATRGALLSSAAPVIVVHRGARPGGLAPRDGQTRYTWTIAPRG